MQFTCSDSDKASIFETCMAEIHRPTVSKDSGFAIPTLSSNTTIDRLAQPASSRNQSLHLYLKLEQRWVRLVDG
jgi:hypothetical protein